MDSKLTESVFGDSVTNGLEQAENKLTYMLTMNELPQLNHKIAEVRALIISTRQSYENTESALGSRKKFRLW